MSPWEAVQVVLLVITLGWTTLCLGGYRAETMVLSSGLTALLLGVHLVAPVFARAGSPADPGAVRFHPAGWLVLPFLLYAAMNARWVSPVPWLAWRDWLGWAQMLAIFWVVLNGVRSTRGRATLFYALVALAVIAVLLGTYQRFVRPDWIMLGRLQSPQFIGRASGSFGIPNSLAGLLILLLPPLGALAFRRGTSALQAILLGYLVLVLAFGLGLTISRGAWLSLGAVLLAWPLFALRRPFLRRAAIASAVLVVLAGLGFGLSHVSPRINERLVALRRDRGELSRPIIWRAGWAIWREHRFLGAGAGNFRQAFEQHRPTTFQDDPVWAHNEYLQLLDDYGLVGFVLAIGGGVALLTGSARSRARLRSEAAPVAPTGLVLRREPTWWPPPRRALAAGLAAFALQLLVDFHLKIPALAMAFAVIAALWVQLSWPGRPEPATASVGRSLALLIAAALVAGGAVAVAYPAYRAEALRHGARTALDRLAVDDVPLRGWLPVLNQAHAQLQAAVQIDDRNAAAWSDLAHAAELRTFINPPQTLELGGEAEDAAGRAVLLSQAVPEFWLRHGVALDLQHRWAEAGTAFVHALTLAPARADVWYYHAHHLARNPAQRERARAAAEFCLRLDPGNREAQALRERTVDRSSAR